MSITTEMMENAAKIEEQKKELGIIEFSTTNNSLGENSPAWVYCFDIENRNILENMDIHYFSEHCENTGILWRKWVAVPTKFSGWKLDENHIPYFECGRCSNKIRNENDAFYSPEFGEICSSCDNIEMNALKMRESGAWDEEI